MRWRVPMKTDRARQFLPFAALKGYEEMLREMERTTEPKRELMEEDARRLNEIIKCIKKGSYVYILHYENGTYTTTEGSVAFIDEVYHKIFIGEDKIDFNDIWDIVIKS
ncbi:hypothetical protein F310043J5_02260 [Anaerostipes hominis (ex Lee et al. 2021)]